MPSTLAIQTFLRTDHTLQDVFQRYDVNYNISPDLGIVVLNYRVLSPLADPLVAQSRGLILELDTWDVVCKSIDAFHEPDSVLGAKMLEAFDWESARAFPKYDGALVCMYYYKDAWHVGTRYSADGSWLVWSITSDPQKITWAELTKMTIEDMGYTWDSFTSQLDKDIFYTFELCAPENRVIVVYTDRKLHLVAAIHRDTLEEIDIYELSFPVDKPTYTSVHSLSEVEQLIALNPSPHETEGFVVVDKSFQRLKVRNPLFVSMMRTKTASDDLALLREIRMMDTHIGYGSDSGSSGSGSSGSGPSGTACVSVDALIRMANGTDKLANMVTPGEYIRSDFGVDGIVVSKLQTKSSLMVVKADSNSLKCTKTQPVARWKSGKKRFVQAGKLCVEDVLETVDGRQIAISAIDVTHQGLSDVIDFTIWPNHTYYADNLLVHNKSKINTTVVEFEVLEVGSVLTPNGKKLRTTLSNASMMTRVMTMCRYMRDVHHAIQEGTIGDEEIKFASEVWPEALRLMKDGLSMTEIMDTTSEVDMRDALIRFETL